MIKSLAQSLDDLSEKTDGCWIWRGWCSTGRLPYGLIRRGSKQFYAHRVSWQVHFGAIPDGLHVLHKCDNPPCIRPDHLFLGTHLDNVRDRQAKGRTRIPALRGEQAPWSKLTEQAVREIRATDDSAKALAARYNVSEGAIYGVLSGRRWKHVTGADAAIAEYRQRVSK